MAIEDAKEVKDAMRRLGLQHPVVILDEALQEPAKGVPRLPSEIVNLTMDQSLDLVARTFGGLIIVKECVSSTGAHFIDLDYACVICDPRKVPSIR